jgi:hypothetical protein
MPAPSSFTSTSDPGRHRAFTSASVKPITDFAIIESDIEFLMLPIQSGCPPLGILCRARYRRD